MTLKKVPIIGIGLCWVGILLAACRIAIHSGKRDATQQIKPALEQSVHDFGNVITNGEPLRHVFRFKNNSEREIRILGSIRSSTCCTSFGTMSKEVGASEILEIPVELKTAGKAGYLRGEFAIRTDSPIAPGIAMELRANLFEPFEVRDIHSVFQVVLGRSMPRHFEVIIRTMRGEPVVWPFVSGMSARLENKTLEPDEVNEDIIESKKDLVLSFEATGELGRRSDAILFRWPDGRERSYTPAWEVLPPLRAIPHTLILDPDAGEASHTVVIRSDELPFQVLGVDGPSVRSYQVLSVEKGQICLKLQLDPTNQGEASKIRIATDHPNFAEVGLNVIIPKPQLEGRK